MVLFRSHHNILGSNYNNSSQKNYEVKVLSNNNNNDDKNREISTERKIMYYGGNLIMIIGIILFLSVFFHFFGLFSNIETLSPDTSFGDVMSPMVRAPIGMVLMVAVQAISNIGKKGLAGSGVKLDPKEARKDLEPFSR